MLAAARLVRLAQEFESDIRIHFRSRRADARSILSLLLLSATRNTPLEIEADGKDEEQAIAAIEKFFRANIEDLKRVNAGWSLRHRPV